MRCTECGRSVDGIGSYTLLINGHTVIQCDGCRDEFLYQQQVAAEEKLKHIISNKKLRIR